MTKCYLYIALSEEGKIAAYRLDPNTGGLTHVADTPVGERVGPLAVDPTQHYLYAGIRSVSELITLRLDPATGELSPHGSPVSLDADPNFLATDGRGRYLFSAYYGGGLVAVHPIDPDGAVTGPAVEWRKTAAKAHCTLPHPSNRFLFLPHVDESNVIFQFLFDEETGRLTPNDPPTLAGAPGQGPRHYCYHPRLDVVYFDNEQGCSVTAYHLDPQRGTLTPFQTLSTLPADFVGSNTCAQLHITASGRYLYAANRGHDSLAIYAIDPVSGGLTALGQQLTEKTPRAFNITPDDRYLYAAGLDSGRLAAFAIGADGRLTHLESYVVGAGPMWVQPVYYL